MGRSSFRSYNLEPSGPHSAMRPTPSRQPPLPHRSRGGGGGGGGSRGAGRASPATQPPPLLPPAATGTPDAPGGGPAAPTPLLPPSATAAAKMEPENKYLPELMAEKDSLDPSFTHAMQLLTAGTVAGARRERAALGALSPHPGDRAGPSAAPGLDDPGPPLHPSCPGLRAPDGISGVPRRAPKATLGISERLSEQGMGGRTDGRMDASAALPAPAGLPRGLRSFPPPPSPKRGGGGVGKAGRAPPGCREGGTRPVPPHPPRSRDLAGAQAQAQVRARTRADCVPVTRA